MMKNPAKITGNLSVGAVYTPPEWARFAIEKFGVFEAWIAGKTVFDPTMGEGNLLAALVEYGLSKGRALSRLPVRRLFGLEINAASRKKALAYFSKKYGLDMRENFYNDDIFNFNGARFGMLFGNPPWCNFTDLPENYKERVKALFCEYGLAPDSRKLLLGGSRMDIAALVIQKTITENLRQDGKAVFFLPLSLFLNDGAHAAFRGFTAKDTSYSLRAVYDFGNTNAFEKIATRHGLALFEKRNARLHTIPYYRFENAAWIEYKAVSQKPGNPYLITGKELSAPDIPRVEVPAGTKPRQGINPCGAINVFVFNQYCSIDARLCKVNDAHLLPKKYVYPLITARNFAGDSSPAKWVLLPYNRLTGKALTQAEMENEAELTRYLLRHKEKLENRKGVLIQAYIKRGIWWAMLGAGPYNFSKYKIVWEAYGKNIFRPRLFEGVWQANQSLQAFIPCGNKAAARRILSALADPKVEEYLRASKMEGTMNWAQPGRIAALLYFSGVSSSACLYKKFLSRRHEGTEEE